MTERQVPCPLCRQENPPSNRLCGSCGAPLAGDERLPMRQEHRPVPTGDPWPAKLGPAGKMLAVGVAAVAAEAGLSWLRRKIGADGRSLSAVRGVGPAPRGYLLSQSLEELLVQTWEDPKVRIVVRREVRSFFITRPTDRR